MHVLAHGVDLVVELLEGAVAGLGVGGQLHAAEHQLVVALDGFLETFVLYGRCRDEVVGVVGVLDEVGCHLEHLGLYLGLDEVFFDYGALLCLILGLDVYAYDAVLLLVLLDVALGRVEVAHEQGQALVEEVAGLLGLEVLLLDAPFVVLAHHFVENHLSVFRVGGVDAHRYDVGSLGGDAHAEVLGEVLGGVMVAHQHYACLHFLVGGISVGGHNGEVAVFGAESVGQLHLLFVGELLFVGDYGDDGLLFRIGLYLECNRCFKGVEHACGHFHLYGIALELLHGVEEALAHVVAAVEAELLHRLAENGVRREHIVLVVDRTFGAEQGAERGHLASAAH